MRQGKRFGLSTAQKSELWRRWKAGQSLHEIGRAFDKEHSSIRCLVARHGGIVPAVRRRGAVQKLGDLTKRCTTSGDSQSLSFVEKKKKCQNLLHATGYSLGVLSTSPRNLLPGRETAPQVQ